MRDIARTDRPGNCGGYMILTEQFGEGCGTIFTIESEVGHTAKCKAKSEKRKATNQKLKLLLSIYWGNTILSSRYLELCALALRFSLCVLHFLWHLDMEELETIYKHLRYCGGQHKPDRMRELPSEDHLV